MLHEVLQFYTTFLFLIVCTKSISITSLERLVCTSTYKPIKGCIGTYILPNVVLTTSYCAEKCESVGNLPIVRSFVHPHYKNYIRGNNFIARNDIALVVTQQNERKRKLLKLSALDNLTAIGLKALIPIMDVNKPRLAVTVVQRCYIEQPFGYYVCAAHRVTKRSIQVCQERQEQGVPLIIEDRIFGIMGVTDKESCKLPQRSFTALSPALNWISETVRKLGYSDAVISTFHDLTSNTYRRPSLNNVNVFSTKPIPISKSNLSSHFITYQAETTSSSLYVTYPYPTKTPPNLRSYHYYPVVTTATPDVFLAKWLLMKNISNQHTSKTPTTKNSSRRTTTTTTTANNMTTAETLSRSIGTTACTIETTRRRLITTTQTIRRLSTTITKTTRLPTTTTTKTSHRPTTTTMTTTTTKATQRPTTKTSRHPTTTASDIVFNFKEFFTRPTDMPPLKVRPSVKAAYDPYVIQNTPWHPILNDLFLTNTKPSRDLYHLGPNFHPSKVLHESAERKRPEKYKNNELDYFRNAHNLQKTQNISTPLADQEPRHY